MADQTLAELAMRRTVPNGSLMRWTRRIDWSLALLNNALIEKLRQLAELEQAYAQARQVQRLERVFATAPTNSALG